MLHKEMNWNYARENFGRMFKETFNRESDILDIIDLNYAEAQKMTIEGLNDSLLRLEKEMEYITDNSDNDITTSTHLVNWCFNMLTNLEFVINTRDSLEIVLTNN